MTNFQQSPETFGKRAIYTMEFPSGTLSQNIVAHWVSFILISVAGWYLLQTFRSWYRLRHFKGPLFATLSRLWLARHVAGGRMHLDFQEVNQKYGVYPT
jgi:hypothetical protein